MIVLYVKSTGRIIGTVTGRIHSEEDVARAMITTKEITEEMVGKYVVPTKTIFKDEELPVTEDRVVDPATMRVGKVIIGKRITKRPVETQYSGVLADFFDGVEKGTRIVTDYKFVLQGESVVGVAKADQLPPAPTTKSRVVPPAQDDSLALRVETLERQLLTIQNTLTKLLDARGPKPKLAEAGPVA